MRAIKCIICGRDKQGAMVCHPCRQAINRMIKYGLDSLEIYIVMMFAKHRINYGGLNKAKKHGKR